MTDVTPTTTVRPYQLKSCDQDETTMECDVCLVDNVVAAESAICGYCKNAGKTLCKDCCAEIVIRTPLSPSCPYCNEQWTVPMISRLISNEALERYTNSLEQALCDEAERDRTDVRYLFPVLKERERLARLAVAEKNKQKRKILEQQYNDLKEALYAPPAVVERFHCPVNDCSGWINEEAWYCNVCGIDVCVDCARPLEYDLRHVCKVEEKDTIQLIKNTTRPCPRCRSSVTKTEGCPHMFCTVCHLKFDWRTLTEISGKISNPHLNDLKRETHLITTDVASNSPWEFKTYDGAIFQSPDLPDDAEKLLFAYGQLNVIADTYHDALVKTNAVNRIARATYLLFKERQQHTEQKNDAEGVEAKKTYQKRLTDSHHVTNIAKLTLKALLPLKQMLEQPLDLIGELEFTSEIMSTITDLTSNLRTPLVNELKRINTQLKLMGLLNNDPRTFLSSVRSAFVDQRRINVNGVMSEQDQQIFFQIIGQLLNR